MRGSWYPIAPWRLQPGAPHLPRGSRASRASSWPGSRAAVGRGLAFAASNSIVSLPAKVGSSKRSGRATDSIIAPDPLSTALQKELPLSCAHHVRRSRHRGGEAALAGPRGGPRHLACDAGRGDPRLARVTCDSGPNVTRWRASRPRRAASARRSSDSASLATLDDLEPWHVAGAPDRLPAGAWNIATALTARAATAAAIGWAHGSYRFDRYRTSTGPERAAPRSCRPSLRTWPTSGAWRLRLRWRAT